MITRIILPCAAAAAMMTAQAQAIPMAAMGGAPATAKPAPLGKVITKAQLTWDATYMDGNFARRNWLKTVPNSFMFSSEKPAGIKVEPEYQKGGKRMFGTLVLGDGPNSRKLAISDEGQENILYIDDNGDGDFSNDKGYFWRTTQGKLPDGKDYTSLGIDTAVLTGSWKGAGKAAPHSAKVGLTLMKGQGNERVTVFIKGAPVGTLTMGGKKMTVALQDRNGTGVFADGYSRPDGKAGITPLLMIDQNGDSFFHNAKEYDELAELGRPFRLGGKWVGAEASADGRTVTIREAQAPPESKVKARPMVQVGEKAPDFEMIHPDGTKSRLSDRKGKVVLLDFWATWCGPCQQLMPKVQELHTKLKGQPGAEVVAFCVGDDKAAFDKWVAEKKATFTFTLGFDPAGKIKDGSGQMQKWGVSGIPTTFVIDKDGKVAAFTIGSAPENEEKLAAALKALGVKLD